MPKQFRALLGRPVIAWSAAAFQDHDDIGQVIIVHPPGDPEDYAWLGEFCDTLVAGGGARADSVRGGLAVADGDDQTPVLIHDAARPGLTADVIDALLGALNSGDASAPALPVSDALKRVDGAALATIDRAPLRRVQTPQAFRLGDIRSALNADNDAWVDDLEAIEAAGKTVCLVPGTERLGKITYEDDLTMMEKLIGPGNQSPRMGTGYDVHRFGPGDHITLCGVRIPHTHGLIGHSDADIGWHALTDAILGAVALGDIGDHFPPSDPQWKGADSARFLSHAQKLAQESGYDVSQVDITLICEAPKIKPWREAMRERTADVLGLEPGAVSVKATTTEGLGFTGRKEGMAGQAAAVLMPRF